MANIIQPLFRMIRQEAIVNTLSWLGKQHEHRFSFGGTIHSSMITGQSMGTGQGVSIRA